MPKPPSRCLCHRRCKVRDPAQYLDSQVLLLQSQGVAQQAAKIADASLHTKSLSARDFSTSGESGKHHPAGRASASTGPALPPRASLHRAQDGAGWRQRPAAQAFVDVRSASIAAQSRTAIAGIDNAIDATTSPTQRAALLTQRTQALVNSRLTWRSSPPWCGPPSPPSQPPAVGNRPPPLGW